MLVVGDEHGRHTDALLERPEPVSGPLAQLCVQVGERLVQQQELRRVREGSRQRDALLLPA